MKVRARSFVLPLVILFQSVAQIQPDIDKRQIVSLNDAWEYLEEPHQTLSDLKDSRHTWQRISIPHTWNAFDVVDAKPGYRRSASWYRRELNIPSMKKNKRFVLSFEGVNISCDVFVNGVRAGGHVGGYVGFDIDITSRIRTGSMNELLVRVDNSVNRDIIPSQKSDFAVYGGITRDVWLEILPSVYLSKLKIHTPVVSSSEAVAEVAVALNELTGPEQTYRLTFEYVDPKGRRISTTSETTKGNRTLPIVVRQSIREPELWSPSTPSFYTVKVRLLQGEAILDELSDRFGLRWFEFTPNGPFMLNGERLLIRGTHRHEDWAGLGNALPDSLHRKDMQMIKEMGANFVRLAHYPQDPEVYRACDELGLLVWDELPWCRGGIGGEEWRSNTKRLLSEQIERHYNHPSIIIRSLGNEMYWLPDFPGGDNLDSLRSMVAELNEISHRLDPGRITSTRKFTEGADLVDMVSPSIWPGWYSGNYKGYAAALEDARKKLPRFMHTEFGGDSHVGRHTESPISCDATTGSDGWEENIKPQRVRNVSQDGDWSESYIVDLFDWMLGVSEQTPWFTGNAQWAFKDFPTPLRPENPIPYVNQKGLVDRAGNPKDAYYVFKSYWTEKPAFVYIESHTWDERSGPKGTKREVNVYSNCPEVELFVNGKSEGTRKKKLGSFPASGLSWQVTFAEGMNEVAARGKMEGASTVSDTVKVRYFSTKHELPDRIELISTMKENGTVLITATVVDKNGRRCLDYNKRIYFSSDGSGKLCVDEGTPTRSSIIECASGRASIEFQPDPKGRATIEARNQDFKGAYLTIEYGKELRKWH